MKSAAERRGKIEKDGTISVAQAAKMTQEQMQGKLVRGVLHKAERPEYCEEYEKLMEKAQGK